ncbi:MAG: methylmalonyl-CoA mutase family protein, partial [Dehalococcoidia bacterium]|nr:methylmalonyl-CoA mutase family protein [Dehalococcoidia bacterium]
FHVQTSGVSLTAQQPMNNVVRATMHALAAALGGAQSMSINAFDEALATPTQFSQTLSMRTQQIIACETGVTSVVDPLGGSYCVEAITGELEQSAARILETLEEMDLPQALDYMAGQSNEAAYRRQNAIDSGRQVVVGINRFRTDADSGYPEPQVEVLKADPAWRHEQVRRLEQVKQRRDQARAQEAKRRLVKAYLAKENIVEPTFEAVRSYLSIGEIVGALSEAGDPAELLQRGGFIYRAYGADLRG